MPRAQLTVEEIDTMRSRLVGIALDLYRKEGAEAVSFRRLAEAADCSHMLPYRYFEDKEALLAFMRAECTRRFEQCVRQHQRTARTPLDGIRRIASGYLAFATESPTEYQLIFATGQPSPIGYPDLLSARSSFFANAVEVVQQAIDDGWLAGDALTLAHLFWVSLHGLVSLHVEGQLVHGRDIDRLFEPLVERMLSPSKTPNTPKTPKRRARNAAPARLRAARA